MHFPAGRSVAHVVVSRSSTGSSARFVSCYAAAFMGMQRASGMMRASMGASVGSMTNMMSMTSNHATSMPRNLTMGQAISGGAELDLSPLPKNAQSKCTHAILRAMGWSLQAQSGKGRLHCRGRWDGLGTCCSLLCRTTMKPHLSSQTLHPKPLMQAHKPYTGKRFVLCAQLLQTLTKRALGNMDCCRSASIMGEYRGIMNLCRVLPNGSDAKLAVDNAIDLCASIGNLRNDIVR